MVILTIIIHILHSTNDELTYLGMLLAAVYLQQMQNKCHVKPLYGLGNHVYIYIYIYTIQRHFEVFKKEATLCHFNQSRRLHRIWMHRRCELMILCLVTAPPFILAKQSSLL